MRLFTCLISVDAHGVSDDLRRRYESLPRSRGLALRWQLASQVAVLTVGDHDPRDLLVARDGESLAAGMVRLDNRADLERWADCAGQQLGDLELVLRTVLRHGVKYVPQFLGDFAFVVWNARTRTAVGVCDALALKTLYYAEQGRLVAFSSRAEALALEGRYDSQYLSERAAECCPSPVLTPYAGVRSVPAGTMAVFDRGKFTTARYWSADDFEPEVAGAQSEGEAIATCRHLLADSIRQRLSGNGETWAQLSGGIDSSSVVGMVQWMVECGTLPAGLAGTVTYVDRQGTSADERHYSNAVAKRWRLPNQLIIDPPFWYDHNYELPRTDLPTPALPFYPREHRLASIIQSAGGRVLLTGMGGDELFTGSMLFFADELVRGRIRSTIQEMLRRAAIGRASFWELAYRNALLPLLPKLIQHHVGRDNGRIPPWVQRHVIRRYGLQERAFLATNYAGRVGHKYHHVVATNLMAFGTAGGYPVISDVLDVRHPFFYRPLVEFALRLPPALVVRPYQRKWVLREAMRGILPDIVRTRVGKGTPVERYVSSLTTLRQLLAPLVRQPLLAELGIVDPKRLQVAFDIAPRQPRRRDEQHGALHSTLVLEAWLQIRSGRWPHGAYLDRTA